MAIVPSWLMPAFLAFGPLFVVIAPGRTYAMVGAMMLSLGLVSLFVRTMRAEKEIERLKGSD